jgi:hypothetical protein
VKGMENLAALKIELREKQIPYFDDEDLLYYLEKNNNGLDKTIYECLILKSEVTTLDVSGLNIPDTSSYFKRLASRFKPNNSRILGD